jgi:hypothetical protein
MSQMDFASFLSKTLLGTYFCNKFKISIKFCDSLYQCKKICGSKLAFFANFKCIREEDDTFSYIFHKQKFIIFSNIYNSPFESH